MEHTVIYETPVHFLRFTVDRNVPLCGFQDWHYGTPYKKNVTCETCKARLEDYVDDEKVIMFLSRFTKELALGNFILESFEDRTELKEIKSGYGGVGIIPTGHRTLTIKYVDKQ